jgi:hypothetical protein
MLEQGSNGISSLHQPAPDAAGGFVIPVASSLQ